MYVRQILFIGVMSCLYVLWDIIGALLLHSTGLDVRLTSLPLVDDTIDRKVNSSDASAFAEICGCCPSQGALPRCPYVNLPTHWAISMGRHLARHRLLLLCRRYPCWPRCLQGL